MSNVSIFKIFRGLNPNSDNEWILRAQRFSGESLLIFLLKPSSCWKEDAGGGCCAGQSCRTSACLVADFSLGIAKEASPLIAPHMKQETKSTFQSNLDHGLVLTAYAIPMAGCTMPMALLWCQPQKLREKARRDSEVTRACLSIKFYTVSGRLSFWNNDLFHSSSCVREMLRQKTHTCLIRCHPKSPPWSPETKRYRGTQTDAINFSLKMKCPFEEMNWTMKVPVVLQKQKGFLVAT